MWHSYSFRRTRLAPTPSGFLHIGNLASFILTCRISQRTGAKILLRIDDIDQARFRPEYLQDIFQTLEFMQLPWDEGPRNPQEYYRTHSQLNRAHLYELTLQHLSATGQVFACTCSRSQLKSFTEEEGYPGTCIAKRSALDLPSASWRLNCSQNFQLDMKIAGGNTLHGSLPPGKKHFQVRKKDGDPSYQLASLVDDIYFEVDLIVRGTDLVDSSWAQLYLSKLLTPNIFPEAVFLHHPLLKSQDGNKISKSAGATSISALRRTGKTRKDIVNLIGQFIKAEEDFHTWEELGDWMLEHWIK